MVGALHSMEEIAGKSKWEWKSTEMFKYVQISMIILEIKK
jgi:hypothetical protein